MLLFFKKKVLPFLLTTWLAFIAATCAAGWSLPAWDLSAGYVAGRLIAGGHAASIYDQNGAAWMRVVAEGHIVDGMTTPYVQTPLYAWIVSPLAARLGFAAFRHVFLILAAAATAWLVFVSAAHWAPRLAAPRWQAGLLAAMFFSVPHEVAVVLGQTHVFFLLLALLAIVAEQRGRPVLAGALLAAAACVKISPGWVAVAWLAAGRWRAVASFAVWLAGLAALSAAVAGPVVMGAFVRVLSRAGSAVTMIFNNDSLAAVLLGGRLTPSLAFVEPGLVVMPAWVKLASVAALLGACLFGGWLDRRRPPGWRIGSVMALVAATAFTPLAWNHYFIVLIVPVVLCLASVRRRRGWVWIGVVAAVAVLVFPPLAYGVGAKLWVVSLRSEFWAALLCLVALPLLPGHVAATAEPAVARVR